jgi:hypothetical protein
MIYAEGHTFDEACDRAKASSYDAPQVVVGDEDLGYRVLSLDAWLYSSEADFLVAFYNGEEVYL